MNAMTIQVYLHLPFRPSLPFLLASQAFLSGFIFILPELHPLEVFFVGLLVVKFLNLKL